MIGILYFSATGNSLYIAQQIGKAMGGEIRYIPAYEGDGNEYEKLILVFPVYSFGMPVHVAQLLPRLTKEKEIVAVLNYGGMAGGADRLFYNYAQNNGLRVAGVYKLKMPENFTLTFTVPKFYLNRALKKADSRINAVIAKIQSNQSYLPNTRKTKEKTYLKNRADWHIIGERFSVTNACVQCGKCVALCPSKNILLTDGTIRFSDKCVACLGCYHRCPQKAIIYRNKRKKDRYVNPNINESDIGKDL
ncbi:MAG: hypothetical protein HFE47_06815 [Clostridia bacterium]|nr:hypothetical protein [Clostridia bacterium]